ncbi:MAG: hypothetical protein IPL46_01550 [Saprospiraceae bacterium]|nr:hypothetical protein [Saprospiraceae bacterium]
MRIGIVTSIIFLLAYQIIAAQGISVSPFSDWRIQPQPNEIVAGNDLPGTYTTAPDHMRLSVELGGDLKNNKDNKKWEVEVQRVDLDWHRDLELYVRLTGEGTGPEKAKVVKGGEVYQRIERSPDEFFKCKGWRYDIPIQFELRGVSLLLPAKTYRVEVLFTIIDD